MSRKKKASLRWGQYYPADSIIHSLDPRTKLTGIFLYIIAVFFANNFTMFAVLYAFSILIIAASRVPLKMVLASIKFIVILSIITGILNAFFFDGETILWASTGGFLQITAEGLYKAGIIILRLIALVGFASILTLTTSPISLTDGLEKMLNPLKRVHCPVHEFAMMMSISLRFIPILMDETDKIIKAQTARGADFRSGSLSDRLRCIIAMVIPLFISALKRAEDLAVAMEARGYHGGEGRTRLKELHWHLRDSVATVVSVLLLLMMIVMHYYW